MSKESFNSIIEKRDDFQRIVDNDKEYDFDLIYALQRNISFANQELDNIREALPNDAEGFEEFQSRKMELLKECGANLEQNRNGQVSISNPEEVDNEQFEELFEELVEEFDEVLEEQREIAEKRNEIINNKEVEVNWFHIKKESYPDTIKGNELPISIIDLIKEE